MFGRPEAGRRGFSLVEMLVVIGIISVLIGVSISAFTGMRASAEKAKVSELVSQTATALAAIFDAEGAWPRVIRDRAKESESKLDEEVAYQIAKRGYMSLTYDSTKDDRKTTGLDRFGIVTPWATAAIRKAGNSATESTVVNRGSDGEKTVDDHRFRFKVDFDGDGIVENVKTGKGGSGSPVSIRANVAVWCCGKDGVLEEYRKGVRKDDVYSWSPGQTKNVNK